MAKTLFHRNYDRNAAVQEKRRSQSRHRIPTNGNAEATLPRNRHDIVNGVPPATRFQVLDQLQYVNSVVNTETVLGGRAPESDKDWFNRGVQRFGRLTDTLVTPKHFELAALEDAEAATAARKAASGALGAPGTRAAYWL